MCQQAQHSHHVIQQVLNHLDTHNKDTPRVRAGIVQVLLETVAIAAKGSVGELAPANDKLRTVSLTDFCLFLVPHPHSSSWTKQQLQHPL